MTKDTVVEISHVSKKFAKDLNCFIKYSFADIAKSTLGLTRHSDRLRKKEFWAVKDVSFKLKKGKTLGIIGPNGSGKTTLLKLINGIFEPDKGKVKVKGKVGALIEVGAGFHPLLTGRENIYINGVILGMSKKEIDKRFDEIVEFANIGDFLDAPVRTYSSGMFVRLGFSIAIHSNPDILLVDEILAVGDYNFQRKCFEKIKSKIDKGMSLILVTHSMHSLLGIAEKTILLKKGKVQFSGPTKDVVSKYVEESNKAAAYGHILTATRRGSGEARIIKAYLADKKGKNITKLSEDSPIRIMCSFKVNKAVNDPVFFFAIKDAISRETVLFCSSEKLFQTKTLEKDGEFEFIFEKPRLGHRRYYLSGGIVTRNQYSVPVDMWDDAGEQFIITRSKRPVSKIDSLASPITHSVYGFQIKFKK